MVTETKYKGNYIPVRGDVVNINFHPQAGNEIWDWHPALVISSWDFNHKKKLAIVCPITSTKRGGPFEVEIPDGLKVRGVVRTDHVKSLDWQARNAKLRCEMPDDIVTTVCQIVETIIWGK